MTPVSPWFNCSVLSVPSAALEKITEEPEGTEEYQPRRHGERGEHLIENFTHVTPVSPWFNCSVLSVPSAALEKITEEPEGTEEYQPRRHGERGEHL